MDYSTISNKTTFTEAEELTNGELNEQYYLLKKQFENLNSSYETLKQELHDTKRSYQTALDVQSHLTIELEGFQADEKKRRLELQGRITTLQEEISALREERTETAERYANEVKDLETEIKRLKTEQANKIERVTPERDSAELDEARAALADALRDAMEAKSALEAAQAEIVQWRMRTEELVSEMGEMREAAEQRREEVRAANEREAAALADLAEARVLLHQYTDSTDLQHAAKGNSIFAEVEDKRQEMAKNLVQMKQTNARLRRELANKQNELDALLHEKQNIWEQQVGEAAHYDRELIESYEERITQLEGLCERQRRELLRWFGKLSDPNDSGWVPAVVDHLKTECELLRSQALSHGAAQLASAAQVRELRRKIALLTASGAKTALTSPKEVEQKPSVDKDDISLNFKSELMKKVNEPVKKAMSVDSDVRKKVSFN